MGITRTFGLLFFLTILVGGCIAAVNGPPVDPTVGPPTEVYWDQAVLLFSHGQVVRYSQGIDLAIYMQLQDGTWLVSVAPSITAVVEAITRCGNLCNGLQAGNV